METKIPKLARNKYNYIQGADGNKYMTQSQIYSMGGGGGNSGGNSWNNQAMYKVEQMLNDRGFTTYDQFKTVNGYSLIGTGDIEVSSYTDLSAYVTKDELERASYVTQTALSGMSYITYNDVSEMSYITKQDVEDILTSYYDTDDEVDRKVEDSTKGTILPSADNAYNLGSSSYNYANTYTYSLYVNGIDINEIINNALSGYIKKPETVWEADAAVRYLTSIEADISASPAWQLTGLDMTPYKRIKVYACAGQKSGVTASNSTTPAMILEISLDNKAGITQYGGNFIGSGIMQKPNDVNGLATITCAVSADKTSFVVLRQTNLYGTGATTNNDVNANVYKIEGWYD